MKAPAQTPMVRAASNYPRTITFKGPRKKLAAKKASRTKIK